MSNSSILGGTAAPMQPDGSDVDRLGPSDRSDSGSDVQGEKPMATAPDNPAEWGAIPVDATSETDALGTGERSSAAGSPPRDGDDIMPDQIIGGDDMGAVVIDAEVEAALESLADEVRDEARVEAEARTDGQAPAPNSGVRPHRADSEP